MPSKKTTKITRLIAYAICCVAIFLALRQNGMLSDEWISATKATIISAIKHIQTYDLGNVIAALLAVGGYLLEHWMSRKASQLEKQMERVEAQSHQLLVPVTTQFQSLWLGSLLSFVDKHADTVLAIQENKEARAKYIAMTKELSVSNPTVHEIPTSLKNPVSFTMLIENMVYDHEGGDDAASWKLWRVSSKRELPRILHEAIQKCNRESSGWKAYEAFVRHSLVPAIQKIADIIDEHGHLMEPVPTSRLVELYGTEGNGYGQKWTRIPRMWFYSMWLAYAKSWQELLCMWDEGVLDDIRPSVDFPVGLMIFNVEAQSIVAKVEQRLIGASQMHGHSTQSNLGYNPGRYWLRK